MEEHSDEPKPWMAMDKQVTSSPIGVAGRGVPRTPAGTRAAKNRALLDWRSCCNNYIKHLERQQ